MPFSHLDFFWGGTREECLARGRQIITSALYVARQYPEFRFLIEDNNFVADYVEAKRGSAEVQELKRLVREGRIEIAPKWAAIFLHLPSGEVQVRNFLYGKRFARTTFGMDPQVAHLGDLPGYIPQLPQIAARSGVPYVVMTRMGPEDRSLFYWKSPDGSKVLTWHTIQHYGWGSRLGLHLDLDDAKREALRKDLETLRPTTAGPVYLGWGSDLWAPTGKLVENIRALNKTSADALFRFATPKDFFSALSNLSRVPEISGEIPSSWPNVVSSLAHMWPLAVPATNTLLAAERFAAINFALGYADYPQAELEFLWKKLIESMDHNHDGQGGTLGDERKIEYSRLSLTRGGEILRDSLRNIADRVEVPFRRSHPIVVFNPLAWRRDDVVRAHVTLYGEVAPRDIDDYKKGMRLVDERGQAIPFRAEQYSENISRALELTFVARDVPSLGYRTYFLVPSGEPDSFPPAAQVTLDQQEDRNDPRRPLGSDLVENDFYRVAVDKATGRVAVFDKLLNRRVLRDMEIVAVEERGGNYIGIEPLSGRTIPNIVDSIALEENTPVRTIVRIKGRIADIPIVQRLILYTGLKRVDVENEVRWRGPRFVRLQQLFPYEQPNAQVHYGLPFGAGASSDVMPGTGPDLPDEIPRESWLRSRHVQDWVFAGTSEWGFTLAADHQLVKLGDGVLRGEMLRGTRHTSVRVVRDGAVTSMFYPPAGTYYFRYSISSAAGDWKAALSHRAGMNRNNPLVPVAVVDNLSRKSLPPAASFCSVEGNNLVVSALKKVESGSALILRLYELHGTEARTEIEFHGKRRAFREVNLLEEEGPSGNRQTLRVGPYEIKTVRLELSN